MHSLEMIKTSCEEGEETFFFSLSILLYVTAITNEQQRGERKECII